MKDVQLLLFDRDGTLTYEQMGHHPVLAELAAYPFAGPLLREQHAAGRDLAVVTNQSGVARGYWPLSEVEAAHQRFCAEWVVTPAFYICPHGPDDACPCRKPRPGLLRQALDEHGVLAAHCLMIGDALSDAGAAAAVGVPFALVLTGRGRTTRPRLSSPPALVLDTVAELAVHLD